MLYLNGVQNDKLPFKAIRSITFAGATPDAIGDFDGTGNPATVFTVTGTVLAQVFAVCTTSLTFAATATIEVGIVGDTAAIIAQTPMDTAPLIAQEIWHDATPDKEIELSSVAGERIISDGNDIKLTVGAANVNTGVILFVCFWTPVSGNGSVT
jgi:hypothetical protein